MVGSGRRYHRETDLEGDDHLGVIHLLDVPQLHDLGSSRMPTWLLISIKLIISYSVRPLTTDPEHVDGCLVQLHEHPVVDLPQPEQLENLLPLGGHLREKI